MADTDPAEKPQKGAHHAPTASAARCQRSRSVFAAGTWTSHRLFLPRVEDWRSSRRFPRSRRTSWRCSSFFGKHHANYAAYRLDFFFSPFAAWFAWNHIYCLFVVSSLCFLPCVPQRDDTHGSVFFLCIDEIPTHYPITTQVACGELSVLEIHSSCTKQM